MMGPGMSPMVKKILIANCAVFVLQVILFGTFGGYGIYEGTSGGDFRLVWFGEYIGLVPALVQEGYLWQLISYMFVHGGFVHLFFNMFVLWMFGVSLERVWGGLGFLQFYLVCGLAAGLGMVTFYWGSRTPVVGASGAIYGILGAYAINWPDRLVYIWGIIPMKIKYLVVLIGASDLAMHLFADWPIAHEAHLTGLAVGLLYAWKLNPSRSIIDRLDRFRKQRKVKKKQQQWEQRQQKLDQMAEEADEILDRMNEVSWEELSEEEKQQIREISDELKDLRDDP